MLGDKQARRQNSRRTNNGENTNALLAPGRRTIVEIIQKSSAVITFFSFIGKRKSQEEVKVRGRERVVKGVIDKSKKGHLIY